MVAYYPTRCSWVFWHAHVALESAALHGVHGAAPILMDTEARAWGAMVWGVDVHFGLWASTAIPGLESAFWGKNPLGRRSGGGFCGVEQDMPAAWRSAHHQCSRVFSLGGPFSGNLEATWPCFSGAGPWWASIELGPHYECNVCCHTDVLCMRGCSLFLARVLSNMCGQARRS
jgi:hypothetical protein